MSPEYKNKHGTWDPSTISAFIPERWLVENEEGVCVNPKAGPAHPFGAGPRGCFGE